MNFKVWQIGLAVATAALSFAGPAWYMARQDSAENPMPFAAVHEPVQADGVFAWPFAVSNQSDYTRVDGRWTGVVEMGRGAKVQFSFNFQQAADGRLTGNATFPVGEGSILDGKVVGGRLSFSTQHRLQKSGQTLVTRFVGNLSDGVIALDMQSEGGVSKLTLNRVSH
ncbi:MAG: hypothetical protein HYZ65_09085 [Burkholderiales bacterium]|nr:hypothetical protein [Burkholderiales bacterium]